MHKKRQMHLRIGPLQLSLKLLLIISPLRSAQNNFIAPKEEMPPELVKKILVKKIEDKVEGIAAQNKILTEEIEKKKAFIDSLKFKLLRKFNQFQELKQKKAKLDKLKEEKANLEDSCEALQHQLGNSQTRLDSERKARQDQVELEKASLEGLEEVSLIKKQIKRLFVFQLVELKKHNQGLIAEFLSIKKSRDQELKRINKGLHYLRKKVKAMRKAVQPKHFESETEEQEWKDRVKELLHDCRAVQPVEDAQLRELDGLKDEAQ